MTNRAIAEFVSHLKSLDVQLFIESDPTKQNVSLDGIRLRCNAPEGTLTSELRQELADRKAELISYLHRSQSQAIQTSTIQPTDPNTTQEKLFPLSFAQQRLWFLYQLTPDNPFYNVPAAIRLIGTLDHKALERSFDEIVRRHAALRTTFTIVDGQPVQVIAPNLAIALPVVNLQSAAVQERERLGQQLATAEAQRPFNLTTDALLRVTILQFDPTDAVLLLTMHHIVADGWSLGVLIQELACFYTAFVEQRSPDLPPLPIQYTDFACWQRNWLQGRVLEEQLAYWRQQLQDLPALHLPSDRPHPAVQTYRGATYPLQFSPTLTQGLASLSQQSGASLFMTLLAAFQTLLYRYTGQEDIAIGSPIANRHRSDLEGLIGFFVNSLVMRSDLSGNPSFRELLERVRNVALEAYAHQDLPFEKLVEELDPERDLSRNPLFQVAFALQNAPMQPLELPGLTLEPAPLESGSTRFDLEVHLWEPTHGLRSLWESQSGLGGFIAYSTDLFDRARIGRLVGHFQTLLEGIVANPDARLSDLPLLTAADYQHLVEWNQTHTDDKSDRCFHQIFEAQVRQTPDAIAVVSEQGSLTYGELNQKAERLAQMLRQMGVRPDSLVGLCVDRSLDMVIGILGILKAGGAYVPLDPNYPSDRLDFMLTDTQVSILLTQSWLVESLPASPAKILLLDQPLPLHTETCEMISLTPDHLAYVIYTSGSTGTPKGVLLSHHGLCNVVEAQQQIFHTSHSSRILQLSSLSFDASIFEIALAFGSGGTLYIPPKSAQLPGMALVQFLEDKAITHALLTPAVLAVLPSAELPDLQVLITGGEACSSQVVDRWAANRHFFNAYGPTETTIWATVAELHPGAHPRTIGRPILNTQVYILDASLNPVPIGIPGELYIGGAGLARGYLNRPELTAERFIDNPFNSALCTPYSALYRTGDRAQYRTDGTIEFLGRVDSQIKIRGFRVELGEIEATLQRHPDIQDVVVIASDKSFDEIRLITYFSLNSAQRTAQATHQHLQQTILQSLQTQQIQQWQTLYNQTYQSPISNPQFNITGWNSSYTGEPIPLEQMQEWVSDRVQQILALKPKRVLEIGCGTGLLLFQIAPHCEKYVGTDFSTVSLASIQHQLDILNLPQVELLQRMATDFEGIDAASFDVVILNSVVQYFPSAEYLMQVLEGAIQAVNSGGVLFVGDVRSLPLLTAFHTWMKFSQADASMERTQLQQQVERSQFEEPELAIAPAFFDALRERFSQIQRVQICLSRGRSHNEMTQFRYNVLLHVNDKFTGANQPELRSVNSVQHHNWKLNPITVEQIQKNLIETEPEIFRITHVTNSRVAAAVQTANWLRNKEAPKTVGRMRDLLQDSAEQSVCAATPLCGIDPQDWWDLEMAVSYRVEITWSTPSHIGDYDVQLTRHGVDAIELPVPQPTDQPSQPYTNDPLQSQFARQLIPDLRQYLKKTLPDYMVPSVFVPLKTLPLTVNGKVDRVGVAEQYRYVTPTSEDSIYSSSATISAERKAIGTAGLTPTESTLIDIWKELLHLKHLNIHDNFFELGGHSLLATQMTSRVWDAFELELPLKSVFEAPTIAQLATILETLRDTHSTPKIPPLIRLDRAAHRRQRSHSGDLGEALVSNGYAQIPHLDTAAPPSSDPVVAPHSVTDSRSPLIPLTLGGSKQPFFCVHPMFGVVFPYLELAHYLGSDRSFYGLQPLGLDGKHPPLTQIEAIAAYYIRAIQALQPHGPYFLGGWSFGGLVAFEMAQQLTQAGQQIALLAILDTPAPLNHQPSLYQSLKFLLGTAFWSTLPFVLDYGAIATNRLRSWKPWFSRWQWSAVVRQIPEESRLQLLDESAIAPMLRIVYANSQAAYRYVPQPYPNQITLFKAAEQSDAIGQDLTLGWDALAQNIQLHQVPGNHLSLLKQPNVQTLAEKLRHCLT
ncbi:amino acid adenylation domain-containing protein [Phormidium sp. CLA17]|uniref:non-ribosomal peptide synthetase n=1 Tax=Leptolyngbya sp. Cla-17 TaxID=2803751 RepID=UPI0014926AFE|nr:non-ribosomal peptide synthetase [Leptolyngbya sp. Cla-17]MBM0744240.1 amino acid adenylation domain-containing protein [Leptolyngbya sp. Cla-17]